MKDNKDKWDTYEDVIKREELRAEYNKHWIAGEFFPEWYKEIRHKINEKDDKKRKKIFNEEKS